MNDIADQPTQTVFVVDDDAAVRDSVSLLLETAGFTVRCFSSAEAFLLACSRERYGCVLLDLRMNGMSGTELQQVLADRKSELSVIFLTAHGDIPTTVKAIKQGAVDFLTKPVDGTLLIHRVSSALSENRNAIARKDNLKAQHERVAHLTARELEVLRLAISGYANKQIARRLAISHRTVEFHRSRILAKTGVSSLVQLAQYVLADNGTAESAADPDDTAE